MRYSANLIKESTGLSRNSTVCNHVLTSSVTGKWKGTLAVGSVNTLVYAILHKAFYRSAPASSHAANSPPHPKPQNFVVQKWSTWRIVYSRNVGAKYFFSAFPTGVTRDLLVKCHHCPWLLHSEQISKPLGGPGPKFQVCSSKIYRFGLVEENDFVSIEVVSYSLHLYGDLPQW